MLRDLTANSEKWTLKKGELSKRGGGGKVPCINDAALSLRRTNDNWEMKDFAASSPLLLFPSFPPANPQLTVLEVLVQRLHHVLRLDGADGVKVGRSRRRR